MRITIDTREDTYEDSLGVLRRAYGRHRLARTTEGSPAAPEAVDLSNDSAGPEGLGTRSASDRGRKDAGSRRGPTKATRKPAAKRTSATRSAVVESPVAKSTVKKASGKRAARNTAAKGRLGAPPKRAEADAATNTAPRGESEAVRSWAKSQGLEVRARGRMPAKVIAAYLEAHED